MLRIFSLLLIKIFNMFFQLLYFCNKDSSDETSCSCSNRLNEDKICDGYLDCPLGTDEIGCFGCDKNSYSCFNSADEFQQSKASPDSMCYTLTQKCNGFHDCFNGKDEEDCSMLIKFVGTHTVSGIRFD